MLTGLLKDVIGTKGIETTAGSRILKGYVPVYDSTVNWSVIARRATKYPHVHGRRAW